MPTVLAVARLPHNSTVVKDIDDNTFVFDGEQASALALANDLDAGGTAGVVQGFYNFIRTGMTHHVNEYLSGVLDRNTGKASIEYYDISAHLNGSPHGSPVKITSWTLGGAPLAGSAALPAQDGAVITIHDVDWSTAAVEVPGTPPTRPRQRHAGRIYIGPLCEAAIEGTSGEARLTATCCTDLGLGLKGMAADAAAIATPTFYSHWSRKLAATFAVVGGHVDNAVDIQRRRQVSASTRTPFTI